MAHIPSANSTGLGKPVGAWWVPLLSALTPHPVMAVSVPQFPHWRVLADTLCRVWWGLHRRPCAPAPFPALEFSLWLLVEQSL